MNLKKSIVSTIFAASIAFGGGAALAQDATPEATAVTSITVQPQKIVTAEGQFVGYVTLWEDAQGVHLVVKSGPTAVLEPGEHGLHIHETGVCDADGETAFESAGGHFNPTDEHHGDAAADPSHAGDLGNLTVEEDGSFDYHVVAPKATLQPDAVNSLNDADGSALVIHAGADDLSTDPSGESGGREACGVIFAPVENAATPAATPES